MVIFGCYLMNREKNCLNEDSSDNICTHFYDATGIFSNEDYHEKTKLLSGTEGEAIEPWHLNGLKLWAEH